ncbi:ADP-ribosylation factor-like protein 4A isoform X3 [Ursus americanus]|uniref:ADP-ribosylation factor-like protein 4A isoform X3 n=1 Tax=Ursus americanus TaxID=9643 RepID=UPI001E67D62C|nr:ADP-ribosylation factor-like protein 4A isoform X3 [Ursus americanus]
MVTRKQPAASSAQALRGGPVSRAAVPSSNTEVAADITGNYSCCIKKTYKPYLYSFSWPVPWSCLPPAHAGSKPSWGTQCQQHLFSELCLLFLIEGLYSERLVTHPAYLAHTSDIHSRSI